MIQLGSIVFSSGSVIISDPSADPPVPGESFSTNLKVQLDPGPWLATAFVNSEDRVEVLSIRNPKYPIGLPRKIGDVGVDIAVAGFFDAPHFQKNGSESDRWWKSIAKVVNSKTATLVPNGVASKTGYGDGFYDVIAYGPPGRIGRIDIVFMDESDVEECLRQVVSPKRNQ